MYPDSNKSVYNNNKPNLLRQFLANYANKKIKTLFRHQWIENQVPAHINNFPPLPMEIGDIKTVFLTGNVNQTFHKC